MRRDIRRPGIGEVLQRGLKVSTAALLVVWMTSSAFGPAHALTSSQISQITSDLSINKALFLATVPSYAVLGHNYTVLVQVANISNESVPIILRIDGPIGTIYTFPVYLQVVLAPNSQTLENFTLIAFNTVKGLMNITATMWVWYVNKMDRPVVAQQVSTVINGVTYSSQAQMAEVVVTVVAVGSVIAAIYVVQRRRGRPR